MTQRVYLDWNATAPLRREAREAVQAALDLGNPSSVHGEGRTARAVVEQAREQVAELLGASSKGVVFTSGGTEANMLALTAGIEADGDRRPRGRLLISTIEHPSVRAGGRFPHHLIEDVPVTAAGVVDLPALERRLTELKAEGCRPLVSLMHANNETGLVQPVREAARTVHEAGGLLHVDAVQTAGRIRCDIKVLDADLLTISGHKLGGPKGIGALVCRADVQVEPLIRGGGQERNQRAGTENVAGIAGFGAGARAAGQELADEAARLGSLRDTLEAGLKAISPGAVVFGAGQDRIPNTTLFSLSGVKAETAVIGLDLEGVAVSSGAACSSGKVAASHVLTAMGVAPELARGAIRLSWGFSTTEREIETFLKAWGKLAGSLYKNRDIAA
jgi:cysteine desulfurase